MRVETRALRGLSACGKLEKELRGMILRNELASDCAITPETELARRYGISRNTVRKALAKIEEEGFIRKIQGRGTFIVPSEERPQKAFSKAKILLALTDYRDMSPDKAYDKDLISGCLGHAMTGNAELSISDPESLTLEGLLDSFSSGRLDGILWERPAKELFPAIESLRDAGLPQVTISRSVAGVPSVFFDIDRSIEESVEFLAGIGHRDIAFVDLPLEYPIYRARQGAFLDALRKIGHRHPESYLCLPEFNSRYEDKFDMLPPVTAMISASFAIDRFYSWCQGRGLGIPRDMSLIALSSENSPQLLRHPELSSIMDPRHEIGKAAMAAVEDLVEGREVSLAPAKIRGELLIRKSCISPSSRGQSFGR